MKKFSSLFWLKATFSFDWLLSGLERVPIAVLLNKTFDILSEMIMEYQIYT